MSKSLQTGQIYNFWPIKKSLICFRVMVMVNGLHDLKTHLEISVKLSQVGPLILPFGEVQQYAQYG